MDWSERMPSGEVNDVYKQAQNPFNRGQRFNCFEAWCQPQRVSKLLPDEVIEEKMGRRQPDGHGALEMEETGI